MSYKSLTVVQLAKIRETVPEFAANASGRHNRIEAAIAWLLTHPTKSVRQAVLDCPHLYPKMIQVAAAVEEDPKLKASIDKMLETLSANPKTLLMKKLAKMPPDVLQKLLEKVG